MTTPKNDETDPARPTGLRKMIEDIGDGIAHQVDLTEDYAARLKRTNRTYEQLLHAVAEAESEQQAKSHYDRPANFDIEPGEYFETTAELVREVEVEG